MEEEEQKLQVFRPLTLAYLKSSEERQSSNKNQINKDEAEACTPKSVGQEPDIILETGSKLPKRMRQAFSKELTNTPLQDLDSFYEDKKTFVVINGQETIFRFNSTASCWAFGPLNLLRKTSIRISLHCLFKFLMLATIFVDIIFMAMPDSEIKDTSRIIFGVIYLVEVLVKIIAQGFILEKFSYLREFWNWLDFLLTILLFAGSYMHLGGLIGLNALRGFRFLKTTQKGRRVLSTLEQSFINLRYFYILFGFILYLLSVLGLQLYMGTLTQTCVLLSNSSILDEDISSTISNSDNALHFEDSFVPLHDICGNVSGSGQCNAGYTCMEGEGDNPDYGYTNFDNFGWSLLSTFRLMTQDFWEDISTMLIGSNGSWHILYVLVPVIIGSLNLINLIAAVIIVTYDMMKKHDDLKEEKEYDDSVGLVLDSSFYSIKPSKLKEDKEIQEEPSKCLSACQRLCSWECSDFFIKIRKFIFSVVYDPFMEIFFHACNILLIVSFALDHVDMSMELARFLNMTYDVFIMLFVIETTLKIFACSPSKFFKDSVNVIETIFMYLALINLMTQHIQGLSFLYSAMLLKCFIKLTSLLKVVTCIPSFQNVFYSIKRSWPYIVQLVSATILFCVIFSIIGMDLFGRDYFDNKDRFSEDSIPLYSFIDFIHSFMVVFRIMCGEWIETLWDCWLVSGGWCLPFYVAVIVVGNFMIVNIFLAIILVNYGPVKKLPPKDVEYVNLFKTAYKRVKNICRKEKITTINQENEVKNNKNNFELQETNIKVEEVVTNQDTEVFCDSQKTKEAVLVNCCPDFGVLNFGNKEHLEGFWKTWKNIRQKCLFIVENVYFQIILAAIILLACILLAFEDVNLKTRPALEDFQFYLIRIICVIFVIEIFIKLIGLGFKTFFASFIHIVDGIVVLLLILDLLVMKTPFLRVFIALRMLHVLNLLRRCQYMEIILNTIQNAIPAIVSIIFIQLLFTLLFAILGVQFYGGKFFECVDEEGIRLDSSIVSNRLACHQGNYTWENPAMNFDNVFNAYFALLEMSIFKGWISILNSAADSKMMDDQPEKEVNLYHVILLLVFCLYQSFFFLKLFVAALLESFRKEMDKGKGGVRPKTDVQRTYFKTLLDIKELKLPQVIPKPQMKLLQIIYGLVTNCKFELFMWIVIMANVLIMAVDESSSTSSYILQPLSHIFMVIYILECIFKMAAWKQHYFKNIWNVFDFLFVILLLISVIVALPYSPFLLVIVKALKIFEILKFSNYTKGLRNFCNTLCASSGFVVCILLILFVVIFIYSIFGVFLFKNVKHIAGINEYYNFETFGKALLTLTYISTGAGWDGVLHGVINENDCFPCSHNEICDCGSFVNGAFYSVSFLYAANFVLMNMFVVVIIYYYCQAVIRMKVGISQDKFDEFIEKWKGFDLNGTGFISLKVLPDFLNSLDDPFKTPDDKKSFIIAMDIPIYIEEQVKYSDVLEALTKIFFDKQEDGLIKLPTQNKTLKESDSLPTTSQLGREDIFSKEFQESWQNNDEKQNLA